MDFGIERQLILPPSRVYYDTFLSLFSHLWYIRKVTISSFQGCAWLITDAPF